MPIRPAPILAVDGVYTRVWHLASGHEDYFGETPAAAEHVREFCGPLRVRRSQQLGYWIQGDWT